MPNIRIFLVVIISLFLTSCANIQKDGPPRFDVDVSRIPDAVPKVEPLSRYGNKPYQVFGQNYTVMHSCKNYEEQGTASWYGTKFDSHSTSSGERYDMLAMTAAHKSLPLPTYVEVTNLKNGKKVIVKVNDRGPFKSDRIIDLSYAAAKKLGMSGHGTAWVNVKAIDPREYQAPTRVESGGALWAKNITHEKPMESGGKFWPSANAATNPGNNIYLQVAAFKNKAHAEHLKDQLTPFVSPSQITVAASYQPTLIYRVQIGPLKNLERVNEVKYQLRAAGVKNKLLVQHRMEA